MSHNWYANWAPTLAHRWVFGKGPSSVQIFMKDAPGCPPPYHNILPYGQCQVECPRCALISNWANHILFCVRTIVPADRGVTASVIGPQIRGDIKKQKMEQRKAAKGRRQTTHPRSRDWGSWDYLFWWGGWRGDSSQQLVEGQLQQCCSPALLGRGSWYNEWQETGVCKV